MQDKLARRTEEALQQHQAEKAALRARAELAEQQCRELQQSKEGVRAEKQLIQECLAVSETEKAALGDTLQRQEQQIQQMNDETVALQGRGDAADRRGAELLAQRHAANEPAP